MKKIIILLLAVCSLLGVKAQTIEQEFTPIVKDVVNSYIPWTRVEFSGKLHQDRLPLSPTVKIFMQNDSLIQISLRAPLVGEVGRIELSQKTLLAVNKLKKCYCLESTDNLTEMYPGALSDIQSILLARIVILGEGELGNDNMEMIEAQPANDGNWMLLPPAREGVVPMNYGYLVDTYGKTRALLAAAAGMSLTVTYEYKNRGEQMNVEFVKDGKQTEATLDFSSVKWGGNPMSQPNLGNYNRVSIKEFMGSF